VNRNPDNSGSGDQEEHSESLVGAVAKPLFLSASLLLTPIEIIAGASPILVPLLFLMSRRDSVDRGWQRAGLVGGRAHGCAHRSLPAGCRRRRLIEP